MNAPLPRTMAWLLALALLAMPSYALLMGHFGAQRWPIRQLILHAEFQRVSATQIERAVAPQLAAGFFAVDLSAMRERLEGIPWVAAVELRKRWPDAIEISIREHRAVARVGAGRLLAEDGSLFSTPVAAEAMDLPLLSADERHLPELYETLRFAERLFGGPGSVREVALEVHGGMRLALADRRPNALGRNRRGKLRPLCRAQGEALRASTRSFRGGRPPVQPRFRIAPGLSCCREGGVMNRRQDKRLVVGLDIGTSKVVVLVGEVSPANRSRSSGSARMSRGA